MKTLLIGEYREGKLLDTTYELLGFAAQLGAETTMFLVGSESQLPCLQQHPLPGRCGRLWRVQPRSPQGSHP